MKVLFIGHYREGTSWSEAAINYILALDSAGVEVVCRPIKLNDSKPEVPDRIQELENKQVAGSNFCIQHLLPNYMDYDGRFEKCIGMAAIETTNLGFTGWTDKLNLMDEVWVFNEECQRDLRRDLSIPVMCVPHAFDISKYTQNYEPLDIDLDCNFTFYVIADWNRRKNIAGLLKAFHLEFDAEEPVNLLLKVHKSGASSDEMQQAVGHMSETIKKTLNMYNFTSDYSKELVLSTFITDEQIMQLHEACDCYVSSSYGEGWGIPAFEAMAMGNQVVCNAPTGPVTFLKNYEHAHLVYGNYDSVVGMDRIIDNLYTAREEWVVPNTYTLATCMRKAYEMGKIKDKKAGLASAEKFSHENVGKLMKELLCQ